MKRKNMSPSGRRRHGQPDERLERESGDDDRSTDFNIDNESEFNFKRTSTPLNKSGVSRTRRQSSAPNFDSEESTDPVKTRTKPKPLKRRKTARSVGKDRIDGADKTGSRGRRSRRRRSENDDTEGLGRGKNSLRQGEEESAELPIADLLRKAQESQKSLQTRYEDPAPLPELTTDTLYVQGRNGFSAVKIGSLKSSRNPSERSTQPVHVALKIHNFSKTLMFFCQGLLGGIALGQVILVSKIQDDPNVSTQINPNYQHVMSGLFLFLLTMSLLAAMDRIDVASLDLEHIREFFYRRLMTVVTFPLYVTAICIHLGAINVDYKSTAVGQESAVDEEEENGARHRTDMWKFSACIIAWFCIALDPTDDSTTSNLEALQKYANSN